MQALPIKAKGKQLRLLVALAQIDSSWKMFNTT
jgi:hypothetical protein